MTGSMPLLQRQYGLWIIGVNTVEAAVDGYYLCQRRYFEFYSLSHLHHGRGKLWLENSDKEYDVLPGDAILITPGSINRYGGSDHQPYVEDSVRFCGPVADMLRNAGVISDGVFHLGAVRRLLPIQELTRDPANDAQINANAALQQLLVDLYNESRRKTRGDEAMEQLLAAIKSRLDYWWTIKELCDMCHISDDQLRRWFLAHTGMLPKNYIEQLKLTKGAELLVAGSLSIGAIAKRLGYQDQFHFSRRFKNFTGSAPNDYRREYSVLNLRPKDDIV